ncbi:MAG: YidC/Oxa1 family insertase periplasmic-domain containing protein [Planctomycetes bacterium]|nr:YidC/Oxa1 family insertase periplasmic-domain containing protein [Planctomycetota bacterium]
MAEVTLTTNRGAIQSFALKKTHPIELPSFLRQQTGKPHIPDEQRKQMPLAILAPFRDEIPAAHGWIVDESWGISAGDTAAWSITSQDATSAVFTWAPPGRGMSYQIAYAMVPGRPSVAVTLTAQNSSAQAWEGEPELVAIRGVHQDYAPGESYYLCWFKHAGGERGQFDYDEYPSLSGAWQDIAQSPAEFVGLKTRFFASFWTPGAMQVGPIGAAPAMAAPAPAVSTGDGDRSSAATPAAGPVVAGAVPAWRALAGGFTNRGREHQARLKINFGKQRLEPQQQAVVGWQLTITDMRSEHLGTLTDVERRIEFTDAYYKFFKILAKAMTWCLEMIFLLVRNYGVAVIVLTLLVKAVLHRTSLKQHASIMKMQTLAPQLRALQDQHKNDKQALAMKQMELWKKNGVNPLGGCLPMFIQIPIFIALYQAFNHSSEMRGQSFLWVEDLTLPDVVYGFDVAWLSWLTVNPLPLIYIGVTIWMSFQQKPPPNADAQQEQMAKMMRWMPVIFGVIFYSMPSGLVLYFTTNAILSTLEIKYIKAKLAKSMAPKTA